MSDFGSAPINVNACTGGVTASDSTTCTNGHPNFNANKKKKTCEACGLEFSSGNQLYAHVKSSPTCRRGFDSLQSHDSTEPTPSLTYTTVARELVKLQDYCSMRVTDVSLVVMILRNMKDLILPQNQQKTKRGHHTFDVGNVRIAEEMGFDVMLVQLGLNITDCDAMTQINDLLNLFRSAITKHFPSEPVPTSKGKQCEQIREQKKSLIDYTSSINTERTIQINHELELLRGISNNVWAVELSMHRKKIDALLSYAIYSADPRQIPVCIGCYCLFCDTCLPQNSHIISDWYFRKVIHLGCKSQKLTFVVNVADMNTVTKSESMTMPMLCRDCEKFHSLLEGALSKCTSAVDALSCLRCNGLMPGDDVSRNPVHLNFMELDDSLPHYTLYGFLVTNLMRLLANELRDPMYAEHLWALFDKLRAEIRALSKTTKQNSDLFLYCIPVGCELYMRVVRQFSESALTLSDAFSVQCGIFIGDGDSKYFATIQGPLVLIGSEHEVNAFSAYQIVPDNDKKVVLPMAEGNTKVDNLLHLLHQQMLQTANAVIRDACDDAVYDYSTVNSVDKIKWIKFCKELIKGYAQALEKANVHGQLLAWCEFFDENATEDLYNRVVFLLVHSKMNSPPNVDELKKRHEFGIKSLPFQEMKLFTKCFGEELRKVVSVSSLEWIPPTTREEYRRIKGIIFKETGYNSHVNRLYYFSTLCDVVRLAY